jgi:hypothetical protein
MELKRYVGKALNSILKRYDYEITRSSWLQKKKAEPQLEQILDGIEATQIVLSSSSERYGGVSLCELFVICVVAKHIKARRIFEIGTFEGNTTLNLALNTDPEAVIFTVDLPSALITKQSDLEIVNQYSKGAVVGRRFKGEPVETKIKQLWGDSLVFDFGPFLNNMDLVFIDGDHTYKYVQSDTRNALRMLSRKNPGRACIIWHDCDYYSDVEKVLEEELQGRYHRIAQTRMAIYISASEVLPDEVEQVTSVQQ